MTSWKKFEEDIEGMYHYFFGLLEAKEDVVHAVSP